MLSLTDADWKKWVAHQEAGRQSGPASPPPGERAKRRGSPLDDEAPPPSKPWRRRLQAEAFLDDEAFPIEKAVTVSEVLAAAEHIERLLAAARPVV